MEVKYSIIRHQYSCHKKLQSLTVSRSSSSPPRSLLLRTGSLTHQPAMVCCDESFSPTTRSIGRLCSVVSSSPYPNYKQKRLLLAWQGSGVCAYIIIISERRKKTKQPTERNSRLLLFLLRNTRKKRKCGRTNKIQSCKHDGPGVRGFARRFAPNLRGVPALDPGTVESSRSSEKS